MIHFLCLKFYKLRNLLQTLYSDGLQKHRKDITETKQAYWSQKIETLS